MLRQITSPYDYTPSVIFLAIWKIISKAIGHFATESSIERVINSECTILFVRKADSPDKAYFTVEIVDNAICQARGYSQSLPGADVRQFLKSYAKYHNLGYKI